MGSSVFCKGFNGFCLDSVQATVSLCDPLILPKVETAACPERPEETNPENLANYHVTSLPFPSRLQALDPPPDAYGGQVPTCSIPRRIRLSKTSGLFWEGLSGHR